MEKEKMYYLMILLGLSVVLMILSNILFNVDNKKFSGSVAFICGVITFILTFFVTKQDPLIVIIGIICFVFTILVSLAYDWTAIFAFPFFLVTVFLILSIGGMICEVISKDPIFSLFAPAGIFAMVASFNTKIFKKGLMSTYNLFSVGYYIVVSLCIILIVT